MDNQQAEEVEVPDKPNPDAQESSEKKGETQPSPAKFIRRSDWGAKPPKWIEALKTPIKKVVLTWTETDGCTTEEECMQKVREIQEEHMKDDACPDIRHNFLVGGDGALYEGRGYTRMGPTYPKSDKTHEELYGKSIEIAFIQRHEQYPNKPMVIGASYCTANLGKGFIEEDFCLVWVVNSEIVNENYPETELQDSKLENVTEIVEYAVRSGYLTKTFYFMWLLGEERIVGKEKYGREQYAEEYKDEDIIKEYNLDPT